MKHNRGSCYGLRVRGPTWSSPHRQTPPPHLFSSDVPPAFGKLDINPLLQSLVGIGEHEDDQSIVPADGSGRAERRSSASPQQSSRCSSSTTLSETASHDYSCQLPRPTRDRRQARPRQHEVFQAELLVRVSLTFPRLLVGHSRVFLPPAIPGPSSPSLISFVTRTPTLPMSFPAMSSPAA